MQSSASNINQKRPYVSVDIESPFSYFDSPGCKAYSLLVYNVIAKASKRGEELGTAEIKKRLGDKYSERFALLDVIDFLGTVEQRQKGARQVFLIRERYVKAMPDHNPWRMTKENEATI